MRWVLSICLAASLGIHLGFLALPSLVDDDSATVTGQGHASLGYRSLPPADVSTHQQAATKTRQQEQPETLDVSESIASPAQVDAPQKKESVQRVDPVEKSESAKHIQKNASARQLIEPAPEKSTSAPGRVPAVEKPQPEQVQKKLESSPGPDVRKTSSEAVQNAPASDSPPEPEAVPEQEPAPRTMATKATPADKKVVQPETNPVKADNIAPPAELAAQRNMPAASSDKGEQQDNDAGSQEADVLKTPVQAKFGTPEGPEIVRWVRPQYPYKARREGREGVVELELSLDTEGRVVEASVVTSAGADLDEAALKAVRKSSFGPATSRNRPVACVAQLAVRFALGKN